VDAFKFTIIRAVKFKGRLKKKFLQKKVYRLRFFDGLEEPVGESFKLLGGRLGFTL